jgi:pseudouridine synthase
LIQSGVVRLNGAVVDEPGRRVDPDQVRVTVRGKPLPGRSALRYFMIHKPVGMITTLSDPEGRRTVRELFPPGPRLFPVGRLDADTSGLLLVTNDGDLAHRLMHPRYGVEKLYRVRISPVPTPEQIGRLRTGVTLEPGERTGPAQVRLARAHPLRPALDIRIHEGRYRQVRRMCEAVGLEVKDLHRYGYGPLLLGKLPRGAARSLSVGEVRRLKTASARPGGTARAAASPGPVAPGRPPRTPSTRSQARGPRPERRASRSRPPIGRRPRGSGRGVSPGRMGERADRAGYAGSNRRGRPRRGPRPGARSRGR